MIALLAIAAAMASFAIAPGGAATSSECAALTLDLPAAEQLTAYLERLLNEGVLADSDLAALTKSLKQGNWINPISRQRARVEVSASIHRPAIERYSRNGVISLGQVLEWAERTQLKRRADQSGRRQASRKVRDYFQKMEFASIRAGSFRMGSPTKNGTVFLTHPFEIMTTDVTQRMWVARMGTNPSKHAIGEETIGFRLVRSLSP